MDLEEIINIIRTFLNSIQPNRGDKVMISTFFPRFSNFVFSMQMFLLIVGCKEDKDRLREVSTEEGQEFASKNNAYFKECSTVGLNFRSTGMLEEFVHRIRSQRYPNSSYLSDLFSRCCLS